MKGKLHEIEKVVSNSSPFSPFVDLPYAIQRVLCSGCWYRVFVRKNQRQGLLQERPRQPRCPVEESQGLWYLLSMRTSITTVEGLSFGAALECHSKQVRMAAFGRMWGSSCTYRS